MSTPILLALHALRANTANVYPSFSSIENFLIEGMTGAAGVEGAPNETEPKSALRFLQGDGGTCGHTCDCFTCDDVKENLDGTLFALDQSVKALLKEGA